MLVGGVPGVALRGHDAFPVGDDGHLEPGAGQDGRIIAPAERSLRDPGADTAG
jgi:hypothetical protein